jgi:FAD/FMN-containing dehydrogenase
MSRRPVRPENSARPEQPLASDTVHAAALAGDLRRLLGGKRVSVEEAARATASADWAHMSPILSARLPAGLADVVAWPAGPDDLAAAVGLAHRHGVPVTVRGKGTGNYGQAIPLHNGLVIDTGDMDRILEVGDGWMRAEAGATFVRMEAAARETGQELAMLPSTVGSTIGGFIAGGAGGTGSIEHGANWEGFVLALDVVPCADEPASVPVEGTAAVPFIHAYGTTGVIATATVRLAPARDWVALFASFPPSERAFEVAGAAGRRLMDATPRPRLLSIDEPGLVSTFGNDPDLSPWRYSLRAILDRAQLPAAEAAIKAAGGILDSIRPRGANYLTSLSFNHVTHRARKARPELCHLQVGGEALVDRAAEVHEVMPETLVHLDGFRVNGALGYVGMLMAPFHGPIALYQGVAELRALGVSVTDPHTWILSGDLAPLHATAATFDPDGLLNPGKLPGLPA